MPADLIRLSGVLRPLNSRHERQMEGLETSLQAGHKIHIPSIDRPLTASVATKSN
jgi:hypothetical protein